MRPPRHPPNSNGVTSPSLINQHTDNTKHTNNKSTKHGGITTTIIPSIHHMKNTRRKPYNGLFSSTNFEMALRFTSIFIIAIVFCEFSGLSHALADTYNSLNIRLSSSNNSPPSNIQHYNHRVQPPHISSITDTSLHPSNFPSIRSSNDKSTPSLLFHSASSLANLYPGIDPDTTVSDAQSSYFNESKIANKKTSDPSFALEIHWSKDDVDIHVCRVHNACIRNDGTLLVHPGLKRYAARLRQCNVRNLDYFHNPSSQYDRTESTVSIDLLGASPARYHIPHFLTDVLPALFSSELIWPSSTHESSRSECHMPEGKECPENKKKDKLEKAGLFVEDRVMKMKVSAWVPQFSAMMDGSPMLFSQESMIRMKNVNDEKAHDDKNNDDEDDKKNKKDSDRKIKGARANDLTCFKSVVSYPKNMYYLRSPEWFSDGNGIFPRHGLSRSSLIRSPSTLQKESSKTCSVNVVFMNRIGWEKRHGFYVGRDLVNIDEIQKQLLRDAPQSQNPTIIPDISVSYFENMTFAQQVSLMQKADVLVGVHGAGLANIIFARRDTPLLEVFPFTYYAGPFNGVSSSLGIKYSSMIAEPDTRTFLECVDVRAKKTDDMEMSKRAKELWVEALRKRKMDGELRFLRTHSMTDPSGSNMKMCARCQRLKVDAVEMTRRVIAMAQEVCGGMSTAPV